MTEKIMTINFCGTDCWPDQGMALREPDEMACYDKVAGYIPANLHRQLTTSALPTAVIPGCGAPYNKFRKKLGVTVWTKILTPQYYYEIDSSLPPYIIDDTLSGHSIDTLAANAMTKIIGAPVQLLKQDLTPQVIDEPIAENDHPFCRKLGLLPEADNTNAIEATPTLCWLTADLDKAVISSRLETINLIGHSRGGVVALVTANLLAKYLPSIKVNVIGLDPVPGPGYLPPHMCTLNKRNLGNYVGIYAIDETSGGFNAVVPGVQLSPEDRWDPLVSDYGYGTVKADEYQLIFSRGRHATIPGSNVADGTGDATKALEGIGSVGELIYYLCLNRLQHWGVNISYSADAHTINKLKTTMDDLSNRYYLMRETGYTGMRALNGIFYYNARGITSTPGLDPTAWDYLQKFIPLATTFEQGNNNEPAPTNSHHATWCALNSLDDKTWFEPNGAANTKTTVEVKAKTNPQSTMGDSPISCAYSFGRKPVLEDE